jgi:hypothetical protein
MQSAVSRRAWLKVNLLCSRGQRFEVSLVVMSPLAPLLQAPVDKRPVSPRRALSSHRDSPIWAALRQALFLHLQGELPGELSRDSLNFPSLERKNAGIDSVLRPRGAAREVVCCVVPGEQGGL